MDWSMLAYDLRRFGLRVAIVNALFPYGVHGA